MEKDLVDYKIKDKNIDNNINIQIKKSFLPISINEKNLSVAFSNSDLKKVLAIVIGTKPDFYKQAPLLLEAKKEKLPSCIISTGQHYDDLLSHGIKEFNLKDAIVCD